MEHPFEGVLLINKPQGCTSHDVVDRVRRKLQMKKVGHAGTLDPNATGLLIILVGRATKISQYLMSLSKAYEGTIKFGEVTDSYDCDGEITQTHEIPADLSQETVQETMNEFVGDQYQTPPMFSAKKIAGVPLYKMARKGKEVEREPRFINVSRYEITEFGVPETRFFVACSKGTYVRSLVHDVGQKLGCGAHLSQLRRTQIDNFSSEKATELEKFEELPSTEIKRLLIPIYQAVPSHVL